jgi:hypothetical protein
MEWKFLTTKKIKRKAFTTKHTKHTKKKVKSKVEVGVGVIDNGFF